MKGMSNMSKMTKPIALIVAGVAVAIGTAVFLTRPETPVAETSAAPTLDTKGHFRGPADAAITLVEFGDYQCPSCGVYHPVVSEVLRRYPTQVRLQFRHYPLISIHQNAMMAAMAAEAAGQQGRYWDMHDMLFEYQQSWAESPNPEPEFLSFANHLGLDPNKFMQSMRSPDLQQRVLDDVVQAREAKVDAVPAFFIKGQRVHPRLSVEDFAGILDAELQKTKVQ